MLRKQGSVDCVGEGRDPSCAWLLTLSFFAQTKGPGYILASALAAYVWLFVDRLSMELKSNA